MKYQEIIFENKIVGIFEPSIGCIPIDEGNSDYQQYLIDTDGGLPIPEEEVE